MNGIKIYLLERHHTIGIIVVVVIVTLPYAGRQGVIQHVDGLNQLHGTWGSLAVILEVDTYEFVGVDNETD